MEKRVIIILGAVLIASLAASAVWALTTYYSANPSGTQQINPAPTPTPTATPTPTPTTTVSGTANNFYLPPTTVNVAGGSYVDANPLSSPLGSPPINPILTITTNAPAYLHITCTDSATLAVSYSQLQLIVHPHDDTSTSFGTCDLLGNNTFSYQLTSAGTYTFDYVFHYTASAATSPATINLAIAVTDSP